LWLVKSTTYRYLCCKLATGNYKRDPTRSQHWLPLPLGAGAVLHGQGHRSRTEQVGQAGLRAKQVRRPGIMGGGGGGVHRGLGRRGQRRSCIFSASSALVGPSRWLTRVTCVSTAMAGIPKALPSTTLAVLRPTPGSSTSSSTVRGTTPP